MRSLIILEVEHGESTDDLDAIPGIVNLDFAAKAMQAGSPMSRSRVTNYAVRIDLPECFRLDD